MQISLHKYLNFLQEVRDEDPLSFRAGYAASLLTLAEELGELRHGTFDGDLITKHEDLLRTLLAELFPTALTKNEIKAATIPFSGFFFNLTERFRNILDDAGHSLEWDMGDITADEYYVYNCCVILNSYFGTNLQVSLPYYYTIPDTAGTMKHFKVTVNADFTEVLPTEASKFPDEEAIVELLNNFNDYPLWKKHFPPDSWLLKGFTIVSLTDNTSEAALSNIKTTLLNVDLEHAQADMNLKDYFRSYLGVGDLNFGIMLFDRKTMKLEPVELYRNLFSTAILEFWTTFSRRNPQLRHTLYQNFLYNPKPVVISDVDALDKGFRAQPAAKKVIDKGIKSFIVIPVIHENEILAVLELSSHKPYALNGLKMKKLENVIPFILNTINRFRHEKATQITAIIQEAYTAIHPSVMWKFQNQAERYFNAQFIREEYILREVSFRNLIPLFGQTDIRNSSVKRSQALTNDIREQTAMLKEVLASIPNPEREKFLLAVQEFEKEILTSARPGMESRFQRLTDMEIHPFLRRYGEISAKYFRLLNPKNKQFYRNRGNLDEAINTVNYNLSNYLDTAQRKAQAIFPHYFEKFKSDGVEYDLFIGQSIAPRQHFTQDVLRQLRQWQLEMMAGIERNYAALRHTLPYEFEVCSMIFIFPEKIDIRFRMDEKRFDVDGAFNSRYEIIKKRLEKAHVKNTVERLSVPGKITIVYFNDENRAEYLALIHKLQHRGLLGSTIEEVEVEDMQGVTGLRALRVSV